MANCLESDAICLLDEVVMFIAFYDDERSLATNEWDVLRSDSIRANAIFCSSK